MALRAQRLERLDGGVDLSTDPRELELLDGATRSPDARDVHGDSGSVVSRRGCAPWWDTGEGRPVFWFSFFSPGTVGNQQGVVVTDEDLLFPGTQPTFPPTRATQTTPTTQPPRFLVTSPASGATCQPLSVTVEWTACRGATGYRILAHTSRTLPTTQAGAIDTAACSYSGTAAAGATSKAITLPANNTQYWIWVFASVGGAMVAAQNVPRPLWTKLAAPSNLTNGTVTSLTPTLTWDAVTGAAGYVVQIMQGATVIVTSGVITTPRQYVPASGLLQQNTSYTWTVTARDVYPGTPSCEVTSAEATITTPFTQAYLANKTIRLTVTSPGTPLVSPQTVVYDIALDANANGNSGYVWANVDFGGGPVLKQTYFGFTPASATTVALSGWYDNGGSYNQYLTGTVTMAATMTPTGGNVALEVLP